MSEDLKEIRRNNLRYIIDEYFEGVDSKFAEILGKQPNQLSRVFSQDPKTRRNIGNNFAREIESVAGLPKMWLDTPHGKKARSAKEDVPLVKKIPVISISELAEYDDVYTSLSQANRNREFVYTLVQGSPDTFALKISTDAMGDCFPVGAMVVFDPSCAPDHRSFVLVKVKKGQTPILRELLYDGSVKYLKALNSDYPVIELLEESRVLGVFVDVKFEK